MNFSQPWARAIAGVAIVWAALIWGGGGAWAAKETPIAFADARSEVLYRLSDLRHGLSFDVRNLTDASVTVRARLLDLISEDGMHKDPTLLLKPSEAVVIAGHTRATVRLDPPTERSKLPPAVYEGVLSVETDGGQSIQRVIRIRVSHGPVWPALAIVAGLLASYAASLWWRRIRPGKELDRQTLIVVEAVREEEQGFRQSHPNDPLAQYSIQESVQRIAGVTGGSSPDPGSIRWLTKRGRLTEAQELLTELLDYFTEFQGFRADVATLQRRYTEVASRVPGSDRPALEALAAPLLVGQPITDREMLSGLRHRVGALNALYGLFLRAYARWLVGDALRQQLGTPSTGWSPDDLSRLAWAQSRLDGARQDLWAATSLHEAERWRIESRVEWAVEQCRGLLAKYAAAAVSRGAFTGQALAANTRVLVRQLLNALPGVPFLVQIVNLAQEVPSSLTDQRLRIGQFLELGDLLATLFRGVVAVTTGMLIVYYTDQAFGTLADYLAAFVWGAGVDVGVEGARALLGRLGISFA